MSAVSFEALQRYLRRLCDKAVPSEDAVLLKRFVAAKDREAFELLIARHGPMVLGTARRFVDHTHDAEDVFQAVFLSLARLAKMIRRLRPPPSSRTGWDLTPVGSAVERLARSTLSRGRTADPPTPRRRAGRRGRSRFWAARSRRATARR